MSLNKIINLFLTKFLPQRKNSSVLSHEFHNYNTLTVDKLRLAFKKHRNQKFRKNISFIKRKKLNNLAIDIGSGTGINTIYLAKYFKKIIAVEPSKSASIISRKYFSKYKNFFWINEYAEDFLNKIKPKALLLVKNEFWPNLIRCVHKADIKIFSISSNFRRSQIFFSSFSFGMVSILKRINYFFVVNENDKLLLKSLNILNVQVTGDTRFDRVLENSNNYKIDKTIRRFLKNSNNFCIFVLNNSSCLLFFNPKIHSGQFLKSIK